MERHSLLTMTCEIEKTSTPLHVINRRCGLRKVSDTTSYLSFYKLYAAFTDTLRTLSGAVTIEREFNVINYANI